MKQETFNIDLEKTRYKKKYYEELQVNKLDKLDEVDRFLQETHSKN